MGFHFQHLKRLFFFSPLTTPKKNNFEEPYIKDKCRKMNELFTFCHSLCFDIDTVDGRNSDIRPLTIVYQPCPLFTLLDAWLRHEGVAEHNQVDTAQ